MADPIINTNSFQPQLNPNRQQFAVDFEREKENDRIQNFIKTNKENKKQETEKMLSEMGDAKTVRYEEPAVKDFPEDKKTEDRHEIEKKEKTEDKIKAMDGDFLKELERDLENRRKAFAGIEYSDGIKLAEIRKKLGSKNIEESTQVKNSRADYQRTLERFKDAKVAELRSKGLSGDVLKQEVTELIKKFGFLELVEMSNAKKEAETELNMGKSFPSKCWGMLEKTANAYNKLPLWAKLGLSGTAVIAGASMATGAIAAAGATGIVASAYIGGKRVLGSVVAATGTAKGLDALHQAKMSRTANKDITKIINELDEKTFEKGDKGENEKYELLRTILDKKIAGVDEHLKNHDLISLCNKFIGAGVGLMISTGMASKAIGGIVEHFHHAEHATGVGAVGKTDYTKFKDINSSARIASPSMVESEAHASFLAGHPQQVPVDMHINASSSLDHSLAIEKGSSIEKTLINHIKAIHPEMKNPGQAAHRMWLDYMHDNKEELIKKVGDVEYQKMLKDGMVNVKPGTILLIDEHDPLKLKLHDIGGKISHLNGHHSVGGHGVAGHVASTTTSEAPHAVLETPKVPVAEKLQTPPQGFSEVPADFNATSPVPSGLHDVAPAISPENVHESVGSTTPLPPAYGPENYQYNPTVFYDQVQATNMVWIGGPRIEVLLNRGADSRHILRACLHNMAHNHHAWNEIKNRPIMEVAYSNDGRIHPGVAGVIRQFHDVRGVNNHALPVNGRETTGRWLARVTSMATNKR